MSSGLTNTDIQALAVARQTPTTLSAGTAADIVERMTGGGSWSAMSSGLTFQVVQQLAALAPEPQTPTTLYAGTAAGVSTSTDGGASWSAVNGGLTSLDVHTLAPDSSTPTRVYAGTSEGVFVLDTSTGGGGGGGGGGTGGGGGDCFIATAAYGSPLVPEVAVLRSFRDRYLLPYRSGQAIVDLYARLSPGVAHALARSEPARAVVRVGLLPLSWWAGLMLASPVAGTAVPLGALGLAAGLGLALRSKMRRRPRR
jgi:hypothetical protein